jgi:hypothetical protein
MCEHIANERSLGGSKLVLQPVPGWFPSSSWFPSWFPNSSWFPSWFPRGFPSWSWRGRVAAREMGYPSGNAEVAQSWALIGQVFANARKRCVGPARG